MHGFTILSYTFPFCEDRFTLRKLKNVKRYEKTSKNSLETCFFLQYRASVTLKNFLAHHPPKGRGVSISTN